MEITANSYKLICKPEKGSSTFVTEDIILFRHIGRNEPKRPSKAFALKVISTVNFLLKSKEIWLTSYRKISYPK